MNKLNWNKIFLFVVIGFIYTVMFGVSLQIAGFEETVIIGMGIIATLATLNNS